MEVISVDSPTIITVKDIRWYKRFWYWVKSLFIRSMSKEQVQEFLYEQTEKYMKYFQKQKWDRFFGQHLN